VQDVIVYIWRVGFKKKKSFEIGKENDRVMDNKSGDDDIRVHPY